MVLGFDDMSITVYKHRNLICPECGTRYDNKLVPIPIENYYHDDKYNGKLKCGNCIDDVVFLIEYFDDTNDKRSSVFETPSFLSIHNVNQKLPSQFKEFQKEFKHRHRYAYGEKLKDW